MLIVAIKGKTSETILNCLFFQCPNFVFWPSNRWASQSTFLYYILACHLCMNLLVLTKVRAECLSPLLCLNLCPDYACNYISVHKSRVGICMLHITIYSYTHMHLIFMSEEAEQLSEAWKGKQAGTAAVQFSKLLIVCIWDWHRVVKGWQSKHGAQQGNCDGIQPWDIYLCNF